MGRCFEKSGINSRTSVFAIIGSPVEQSVSPLLHNAISRVTGKNFVYCAFRVEPDRLGEAIGECGLWALRG